MSTKLLKKNQSCQLCLFECDYTYNQEMITDVLVPNFYLTHFNEE